jgi:hypothetical protein
MKGSIDVSAISDWWKQFCDTLRATMIYDLRPKLKERGDPLLAEEEFINAFDALMETFTKHADGIRPYVWVYVLRGYANAITNEMKGANPCPQPEPSIQ